MTGSQKKKKNETGDNDWLYGQKKSDARRELIDWEIQRSQGIWVGKW